MKRGLYAVVAGFFAILVGIAQPVSAAPIQLGFLVDSSGSIGSSNFHTLRTGIANAFTNVLPLGGQVEITLVRFASGATTIVAPTLINTAADLTNVVNAVNSMAYTAGSTRLDLGLQSLTALITHSSLHNPNEKQVYNISTDGVPCCVTNAESLSIAARNAALAAGVDEIDAEFIGSVGSAGFNFLLNSIVSPQPGVQAPPFVPGFVVPVTYANFEAAFTSKLEVVTSPTPEPGTWMLMSTGLVGLLGYGWRKRQQVA